MRLATKVRLWAAAPSLSCLSATAKVKHLGGGKWRESANCRPGCRTTLLIRRKQPQIRTLVARRERCRKTVPGHWNTEAGRPERYLISPADLMPRER